MKRPTYRTLFASAARTTTQTGADIPNEGYSGVEVTIDATALAATPSVVFTIQGKDLESGQYYTILASVAITGVSTTVLRAFPGATAAANTVANFRLPAVWRVIATAGDSDSLTYSVGVTLLP